MRHLVRQHRGELGVVVGERQQPARDVEVAVGQREGVDRGRIEDGDVVAQVRPLGGRDQPLDGLREQAFEAARRDRRRHRRRGCARARAAPAVELGLPGRLGDRGGAVARSRRSSRQAAAARAAPRPAPRAGGLLPVCPPTTMHDPYQFRSATSICSGLARFDARTAALLDPAPHPDLAAG